MKRLFLLASALFLATPVSAAEITSRITDSVQLTVDGPAVQSTRIGSSYSVSGSNISVETLGGLAVGSATAPALATDGSYDINTDGQAFSFSETTQIGDTPVTSQSCCSGGQIAAPNLYGDSITSSGGTAGTLAGTLTAAGVPTVTAGGAGTTAIGQRTIELSVFR
jgi:hypothetical protein|tara:strand:- start:344 stop:841 length:498 start_codon:yes stop_codon:yes gene_type:complete